MYRQRYNALQCCDTLLKRIANGLRACSQASSCALLILVAYSPSQAMADDSQPALAPFYTQLQNSYRLSDRSRELSLLQRVIPAQINFDTSPINAEEDDDLAFNYLWMQQHQQGYKHKNGGAAFGKLLRMGVKQWYQSYRGNSSAGGNVTDEDITSTLSKMDYRLKVSGDKVKLGVEYEF